MSNNRQYSAGSQGQNTNERRRKERRRVVITGVGPVTPIGIGKEVFWRRAMAGTSGTSALVELPGRFPVDSFASQIVARVDEDELAGSDALVLDDRRLVFADLAARLALADGGLEDLNGFCAGLVLGNAVGAPILVEREYREVSLGSDRGISRDFVSGLFAHLSFHTPTRWLADRYSVTGPELTISTGCTAGLDAVGTAFELIKSGQVDITLTGSAEAPLTPVVITAFDRIGALSTRNHDPERASRPFDCERDGFVLAEGAAILILEERGHALERGARIYAEIESFTSLSNSYHMTNLPADGASLGLCLGRCLEIANVDPRMVDHVCAHGSSTPQNDLCETNAVKAIFGRRSYELTINSLKSMIGHALGASNAIEIIACALSLEHQEIHPTAHHEVPGEGCDLDYVAGSGRRRLVRRIVKLSSGFSGIHSAMVLARNGLAS